MSAPSGIHADKSRERRTATDSRGGLARIYGSEGRGLESFRVRTSGCASVLPAGPLGRCSHTVSALACYGRRRVGSQPSGWGEPYGSGMHCDAFYLGDRLRVDRRAVKGIWHMAINAGRKHGVRCWIRWPRWHRRYDPATHHTVFVCTKCGYSKAGLGEGVDRLGGGPAGAG